MLRATLRRRLRSGRRVAACTVRLSGRLVAFALKSGSRVAAFAVRLGRPVAAFAHDLPRGMPLLLIGLGALTSCESGGGGRTGVSPSAAQAPGDGNRAGLPPDQVEALRADVVKALRVELRPEVVADLRRELTPVIQAELLAEARREPRPVSPDASADGESPDNRNGPATPPAPGEPGNTLNAADPWSEPGTRIWPSAGGLKLVELVVGTALEDKLPTDVKTHYPSPPEILYCYSVFENPEGDATVTHVWRRGSRLVSRVELEVGNSPKWRTWSKQRTQPHWTGLWSCEVLGADGQQLGLTVFQIGG